MCHKCSKLLGDIRAMRYLGWSWPYVSTIGLLLIVITGLFAPVDIIWMFPRYIFWVIIACEHLSLWRHVVRTYSLGQRVRSYNLTLTTRPRFGKLETVSYFEQICGHLHTSYNGPVILTGGDRLVVVSKVLFHILAKYGRSYPLVRSLTQPNALQSTLMSPRS